MKNKKGITLVALIITIIVMLILIAVTVTLVINSGIIPTAKEAATSYKTAKDSDSHAGEQAQFEIDGVTYYSVEEYRQTLAQANCVHEWGEYTVTTPSTCSTAGVETSTCTKCGATTTRQLATLAHKYSNWTILPEEGKEQGTCSECGATTKRYIVGAVINGYDPSIPPTGSTPINTSYISKGSKTSTTGGEYGDGSVGNGGGDRTFTVSSIEDWKILGEENGQLIITTSNTITATNSQGIIFKGFSGYAHCFEELNRACSIYGQGKYADRTKFDLTQTVSSINSTTQKASGARSINADDFERIGYEVTRVGTSGTNTATYTAKANGYVYSSVKFTYWDKHTSSGTGNWVTLGPNESVTIGNYVFSIVKPSGSEVSEMAETMILYENDEETYASYWLASPGLDLRTGQYPSVKFACHHVRVRSSL